MRTLIASVPVVLTVWLVLWIPAHLLTVFAAIGVYRLTTLAYDTVTHRNVKFFWKEIFNA